MSKLFVAARGVALIALSALLAGGAVAAPPYNLTLSGASPGGLWSTVGAAFNASVAAAYPGSTITYQTSGGGLANAQLLADNKVPIAIINDFELLTAVQGAEPFKAPIKDLRVVVRGYPASARFQMLHLLLTKSFAEQHGIKSLDDLKAKKPPLRMALNRRGNLDVKLGEYAMQELGIGLKDIESWGGQVVYAASGEQAKLMANRRIDMLNIALSVRHRAIQEAANAVELVAFGLTEPQAKAVAEKVGGQVCPITKKDYEYLVADSLSVCQGGVIAANASLPDEIAYDLAKAAHTQIDKYKAAHRVFEQSITPEKLVESAAAPYHPGALKYYREAGLVK
ncbi:MAG: TAXI family TRAP transporter solute-binding subunit [Burkholderiales bacterium]|nr:TAXI family TRAP transporter solute-binding subunit [Burkholderiales bacterium]